MRKTTYILLGFVIFFTSCYKYKVTDLTPTNNLRPSSDSVYLHKIIEVEKDVTNVITDSILYQLRYDASKRVTTITAKDLFTNDSFNIYYFYSGTSQNAVKDSSLDAGTTVHYYTYNNLNQITIDSLVRDYAPFINIETNKYSYTTNKIYRQTKISSFPGPSPAIENRDTATLDATGNVLSHRLWQYITNPPFLAGTSSYTYDNKNSPYKMVNIAKNLGIIHDSEYNVVPQPNNLVTLTQNDIGAGMTFNFSRTYIYNNNNYPVKCNEVETTYNTKTTYYYFYTAL